MHCNVCFEHVIRRVPESFLCLYETHFPFVYCRLLWPAFPLQFLKAYTVAFRLKSAAFLVKVQTAVTTKYAHLSVA
jgi:hypothetical protein